MSLAAKQECTHAQPGDRVTTACGGQVVYSEDLPCKLYRGATIYFCLPACVDKFDADPADSCVADCRSSPT